MSEGVANTETSEAPTAGGSMTLLWPCVALALIWLVLDHATKFWAIAVLKADFPPYPVITIIPGCLRFVYAENTGAAFSFMEGKTFMLGLISAIATVGLGWFWYSLPAKETPGRVGVALILSGAVGNMIDRFARGYVVDFIDAYWGQYHWPTFNVADSCICVGATIMVLQVIRGRI